MPGAPGKYLSTLNYATSCRNLTIRITGWQWSVAELPVRVDAIVGSGDSSSLASRSLGVSKNTQNGPGEEEISKMRTNFAHLPKTDAKFSLHQWLDLPGELYLKYILRHTMEIPAIWPQRRVCPTRYFEKLFIETVCV